MPSMGIVILGRTKFNASIFSLTEASSLVSKLYPNVGSNMKLQTSTNP